MNHTSKTHMMPPNHHHLTEAQAQSDSYEMTDHCNNHHEGHEKEDHGSHHGHMVEDFKKRFWISILLTIPIFSLSSDVQNMIGIGGFVRFSGSDYVVLAIASFVFFWGGYPFLSGMMGELKSRKPGMMTLISVAITTAYFYSTAVVLGLAGMPFFWELVTLIDVMLLGHWIEMKSVMGASRALEELVRLMPSQAHKIMSDGTIKDVPLNSLSVGDKVVVKPGEKVPADGKVLTGATSVNESMLTGESTPVNKTQGTSVIGGAINGEGSITFEVQKTGAESFLYKIVELVKEAQESRSRTQDLANRAALILTYVALGGGFITFVLWFYFAGKTLPFGIERAVTVMVIACPHALGLAVPLVVAVSTALGARHGLLIRDRSAFEAARNLQAIIFDKTGTLTQGKFGVTDTVLLTKDFTKEDFLQLAASIEVRSEHPIAKGIVAASAKPFLVEKFLSIPGRGAEGLVNGRKVQVVSPGFLKEKNLAVDHSQIDKLSEQGKTVVFVIVDGKVQGAIALADMIRPESKEAITKLKAKGIKCMMLTGDNRKVAQWVAKEIGLDEVFAEVLPQEKALKIKEVQKRGLVVAMTGDGVNDAPALAQADVGIAIGAGTDVAIETADIVLVKNNPLDVVDIISLSRATYKKMIQNLWWAAGYNIVAIPLAAGVLYPVWGILLGPAAGAVLMSLSTVIVSVNARFLKT